MDTEHIFVGSLSSKTWLSWVYYGIVDFPYGGKMTAGNNTLSFTRGRGEDKTPTLGLCFSFRSDWTNMGQVSVPSPITATRGMLGPG